MSANTLRTKRPKIAILGLDLCPNMPRSYSDRVSHALGFNFDHNFLAASGRNGSSSDIDNLKYDQNLNTVWKLPSLNFLSPICSQFEIYKSKNSRFCTFSEVCASFQFFVWTFAQPTKFTSDMYDGIYRQKFEVSTFNFHV